MREVWRVLARHRDLRLVLSAGLVSLTGDWILRIGLVYRVYALTGATADPALTMAASLAPQVLLGPVAGVFADRWDRKHTMVVSDVLLAGGLAPLLLVRRGGDVWIVLAVMFWEGAIQQFFAPAEQAMLPRLVPGENLVAANALNGQNRDLARLAGSALGGIIGAAGGIAAVALADAATFAISAAVIALVRASGQVAPNSSPEPAAVAGKRRLASVCNDLAAALRLSAGQPVLRALAIFVLVTGVGEGIMGTLFAPFVRHVLHGSSQVYGIVAASQAIGGIAGGLLAASLGRRVSAFRLFGVGAAVFGAVDLAIFLYPLGYVAVWPAAVGMVIVGLPAAVTMAGMITLFQRHTGDALRGRVFGAFVSVEGVAMLVGTMSAGYLGQVAGIIPVLAFQGAAYLAAGLATLAAAGLASYRAGGRQDAGQNAAGVCIPPAAFCVIDGGDEPTGARHARLPPR